MSSFSRKISKSITNWWRRKRKSHLSHHWLDWGEPAPTCCCWWWIRSCLCSFTIPNSWWAKIRMNMITTLIITAKRQQAVRLWEARMESTNPGLEPETELDALNTSGVVGTRLTSSSSSSSSPGRRSFIRARSLSNFPRSFLAWKI